MSLPTVTIVEQPAAKALRFRYECEGRSAGSLPGASSTQDRKTFPKIVITPTPTHQSNKAVVVVSCVTLDAPHRPHPHNLVGKEGCKKGVCTLEFSINANGEFSTEFSNLGIQCVKKKDIEESLKIREEIRVDPFRTGFTHKSQPGSIDLNAVRLCFQVFLEGPERGQFKVPLRAVVSDPIYDKKAINDLTIIKLSECSSPVLGGKEVILLCDKVSKDDIEIRFFEECKGSTVWEALGEFQPSDVHKQYAISFRTPQYRELETPHPVQCYIQLRCPSKDTTSLPRPFHFTPIASDLADGLLSKRKRNAGRMETHFLCSSPSNQNFYPSSYNQQFPQQQQFSPYTSPSSQQPPLATHATHATHEQKVVVKEEFLPPPQYCNNWGGGGGVEQLSNISLPNLSDVNLSLLESHLSENFSERLDLNGF